MGHIHFLLGGARSGKSSYAEELAGSISGEVAYIATAQVIDEEMQKRVDVHKSRRHPSWKTFEFKDGTPDIRDFIEIIRLISLQRYKVVIIDCITILLFRIIHKYRLDDMEIIDNNLERLIEDEARVFFTEFLNIASSCEAEFIMVSNEVGMGVVPAYPLGRVFRDIMGSVNKQIAAASDEVYFFIAGLKQKIK